MRYYGIKITDEQGNLIVTPSSVEGTEFTYTSYADGQNIPGALQVEMDIPVSAYATPMKGAMVRIWGVTVDEISAASQLNPVQNDDGSLTYKNITIEGGMQKGLPLANPEQIGILVQGSILQAFGNWIGTNMSLDIILAPPVGTNTEPKNIVLDWQANTPLAVALRSTLFSAFPEYGEPTIDISANLVLNYRQAGFYNTLSQFATAMKEITRSIIGGTYGGIDIFLINNTIQVFDTTATQDTIKDIAFQDLIGQPTWIEGPVIQFKCAMRGDILLGNAIRMPEALITTTSASPSSLVNLKSAFEGVFYVNEIRHVGNFRQPEAESWISTFNASPVKQVSAFE